MHHVGVALTTLGLFTALLLCLMLPMYQKNFKGIGRPAKAGIQRTFQGRQTHAQPHHHMTTDPHGSNRPLHY